MGNRPLKMESLQLLFALEWGKKMGRPSSKSEQG